MAHYLSSLIAYVTPSLVLPVRDVLNTQKLRRIDVHHHFFPSSVDKIQHNEKVGWRTPEENLPWTAEISLNAMNSLGIDVAILSLPALSTGIIGEENRIAARTQNEFLARTCTSYEGRFGFFATLPFPDDTEGAIAEIAYAFDVLQADGIALASSYGEGNSRTYIGADRYEPIWDELNRRKTVVFLHGAAIPSPSTSIPDVLLGLPITEVPNETFKAAAQLVVTGKKRRYPAVKIILAHLGGCTPFLAARVAVLSRHMGCTLTPEEILQDFKTFYFETALSAYGPTLAAMETFAEADHILFGTDFPAVSTKMADWYTRNLEEFYAKDADKFHDVMYRNALKLFPRTARA